jgi:hypothetical protein
MGVEVWYLAFVSTQMSFDKICHVGVTTKCDGQVLLFLFVPVSKVRFLLFPGFIDNRMSFTVMIMNSPRLVGFSSGACEGILSQKITVKFSIFRRQSPNFLKQYRGL